MKLTSGCVSTKAVSKMKVPRRVMNLFHGEEDQVKFHDNNSNISTPFRNKAGQFDLIYGIKCRLQSWYVQLKKIVLFALLVKTMLWTT